MVELVFSYDYYLFAKFQGHYHFFKIEPYICFSIFLQSMEERSQPSLSDLNNHTILII